MTTAQRTLKYRGREYACECVEVAHVSDKRIVALVEGNPGEEVAAVALGFLEEAARDLATAHERRVAEAAEVV